MGKAQDRILCEKMKIVHKNTYHYLELNKMQLSELAKKMNANYNSLWKSLNRSPDKANYTLKTLILIADALNIDVIDLLVEKDSG